VDANAIQREARGDHGDNANLEFDGDYDEEAIPEGIKKLFVKVDNYGPRDVLDIGELSKAMELLGKPLETKKLLSMMNEQVRAEIDWIAESDWIDLHQFYQILLTCFGLDRSWISWLDGTASDGSAARLNEDDTSEEPLYHDDAFISCTHADSSVAAPCLDEYTRKDPEAEERRRRIGYLEYLKRMQFFGYPTEGLSYEKYLELQESMRPGEATLSIDERYDEDYDGEYYDGEFYDSAAAW